MADDDTKVPGLFDQAALEALDKLSQSRRAPAAQGSVFGPRGAQADGAQAKLAEHVADAQRARTHLGVPVHQLVVLESGGVKADDEDAGFYLDSYTHGADPWRVPEGWSLVVTDVSVLGPLVVNDMNLPVTVLLSDDGRRRFATHVRVRESCHHRLGSGFVVTAGTTPRVKAPARELTVQLLGYLVEHPGAAG